jgi:hypothetical protein
MKLYVVTYNEPFESMDTYQGVFSTKELAEKWVKETCSEHSFWLPDNFDIAPTWVDDAERYEYDK